MKLISAKDLLDRNWMISMIGDHENGTTTYGINGDYVLILKSLKLETDLSETILPFTLDVIHDLKQYGALSHET